MNFKLRLDTQACCLAVNDKKRIMRLISWDVIPL